MISIDKIPTFLEAFKVYMIYEVKNIWKAFQNTEKWRFLFGISCFVLEILTFLFYAGERSEEEWRVKSKGRWLEADGLRVRSDGWRDKRQGRRWVKVTSEGRKLKSERCWNEAWKWKVKSEGWSMKSEEWKEKREKKRLKGGKWALMSEKWRMKSK